MIYFSEISGEKVYTEDRIEIGKLEDFIFLAKETAKVTKLVIRTNNKQKLIVPIDYLKKINSKVTIRKDFNVAELQENELHLVKNLLDKQIIDLIGNKMVRVNDVALQEGQGLYIAGVDIGILGILRWFRLDRFIKLEPKFLSWADIQPLELSKGRVIMKKEEEKLEKVRPEDLADHLEKTNLINVKKILNILDESFAAEVIGNLNINYQTGLFKQFSPEKAARIIKVIYPDEAVDILLTLSKKRRDRIIEKLEPEKKKEINKLLDLSKTPIGKLITSEFITVSPTDTVAQVIEKIRKETPDYQFFYYLYVINEAKQLVGVFNLHELLLQASDTLVYKFMVQNVVVVHLTTPVEIVINKLLKYKVLSLPVINKDKQVLGIVTYDDVVEFILEKIKY